MPTTKTTIKKTGCQKHGVTNCIPCKTSRGAKTVSHRRQTFGRFNQPVKCNSCGKGTTWSEANGYSGLNLCKKCFDAATIENAHFDGYHEADRDGFAADCPLCQTESKQLEWDTKQEMKNQTAKTEKETTNVKKTAKTEKKTTLPAKVLNRLAADNNDALEVKGELVPTTAAPLKKIEIVTAAGMFGGVVNVPPTTEERRAEMKRLKKADTDMRKAAKTAKKTAAVPPTTVPPTADGQGPNARWPFGVKITNAGVVSYERFGIKQVRNNRVKFLTGTEEKVEAVDYVPAAEVKTAEVNQTESTKKENTMTTDKKTAKKTDAAKKAAKEYRSKIDPVAAKMEAKLKAAKKKTAAKTDAAEPVVKLLAKGVFYFPVATMALINGAPYVTVEVKGNKVTLTPTKSAKDSQEVRHNQIGVSKVLKDTTWNKKTQELPVKVSGESFVVTVQ